ncbi:MAG: hypothetical protein KC502_03125 [Myxococcales bacterium]|nr:hypothetical protein [Myxococcales bacterium]
MARTRRSRLLLTLGLCVFVAGCGQTSSSNGPISDLPDISSQFGGFGGKDAQGRQGDAGAALDSGPVDAGSSDVGSLDAAPFDTGSADAGQVDAGPDTAQIEPDAMDAGGLDAGAVDSSSPDAAAACGDGTCNIATENCQICPQDCGKCPALCGDKSCNGDETCTSCPADCGVCPGGCGDGKCDGPKEDCKSCSADCGICPGTVCEPLTSKGCTAAQQCYPTTSGGPLCGTPGQTASGTACKSTTECTKGLLCVGQVCKPLCDSTGKNASYKCANGTCSALQYSDGKPVGYSLGTCTVYNNCNATTEVGCASSEVCALVTAGKTCLPAGTKTVGQGCTTANDCIKGAMCIGNPAICALKCSTKGGSPSCPSGKKCIVVTDNSNKAAPDNLGICN